MTTVLNVFAFLQQFSLITLLIGMALTGFGTYRYLINRQTYGLSRQQIKHTTSPIKQEIKVDDSLNLYGDKGISNNKFIKGFLDRLSK